MSTTGQLSVEDSSAEQSAIENEQSVRAGAPRRHLNLVDWIGIGIVFAGLAGIIYWLRW